MEDSIKRLARLIAQRNALDKGIARVIGRPALAGHFGEFIASNVFDIDLHPSGTTKGNDGRFTKGPLAGKTVEIKYYPKNEGLLDIKTDGTPDFYLVLTGPRAAAASSRGTTRPWVIEAAYLFENASLLNNLTERNLKIGVATSVRRELWDRAEIYPGSANGVLTLTEPQAAMLLLFSESSLRSEVGVMRTDE